VAVFARVDELEVVIDSHKGEDVNALRGARYLLHEG